MAKKQKRKRKRQEATLGRCLSCDQPLGKKGGMGGTKLCGPCCTGEADTISEYGESW